MLQRYVTLISPMQECVRCVRLCHDNTADYVDQWAKSLFFPDTGCKVQNTEDIQSADFSALKNLGDVQMKTEIFDTHSSNFFFILCYFTFESILGANSLMEGECQQFIVSTFYFKSNKPNQQKRLLQAEIHAVLLYRQQVVLLSNQTPATTCWRVRAGYWRSKRRDTVGGLLTVCPKRLFTFNSRKLNQVNLA